MICPKCQSYVNDFSRFCTQCGSDIYDYRNHILRPGTGGSNYHPGDVPTADNIRLSDTFAKTSIENARQAYASTNTTKGYNAQAKAFAKIATGNAGQAMSFANIIKSNGNTPGGRQNTGKYYGDKNKSTSAIKVFIMTILGLMMIAVMLYNTFSN